MVAQVGFPWCWLGESLVMREPLSGPVGRYLGFGVLNRSGLRLWWLAEGRLNGTDRVLIVA